jgi:uncharacterized membrane protein YvbJ
MFCPQCGEENPDDNKFCSKCGAALTAKAEKAPSRRSAPASTATGGKTSGMAIAALVMGILSFVVFGPLAVLAIVFGALGISQTNKDPALKGKGMAVAGLVMGIIGVAGWIIAVAVWSSWWWFI